jgi:hypothetical protein
LEDLPVIVETAARSLEAEAMLRWSFGEERFEERIRRHFTHYDGENVRRGWIRIAADGAGIAVWIPPDARGARSDRSCPAWRGVGDLGRPRRAPRRLLGMGW